MTYSKQGRIISIEMKPLFGKVRPELYIGDGNGRFKVATFGSAEKAEMFQEWLEYFFGGFLERDRK